MSKVELIAKYHKLEEQLRKGAKEIVDDLLKDIFNKLRDKGLVLINFQANTPSFNDGDPCTWSCNLDLDSLYWDANKLPDEWKDYFREDEPYMPGNEEEFEMEFYSICYSGRESLEKELEALDDFLSIPKVVIDAAWGEDVSVSIFEKDGEIVHEVSEYYE